MPLRQAPSTMVESHCAGRNPQPSKPLHAQSSPQLSNLEEFPPLKSPRGTPSTPRKRVSKPSTPKGDKPSTPSKRVGKSSQPKEDPPSTPSKRMCKLSLTEGDPPSTPSKRAAEPSLPKGDTPSTPSK